MDEVTGALTHLVSTKGAVAGLRQFIGGWKSTLEASGYEAGCPVLAIAVEPYHPDGREGAMTEETAEAAAAILERTAAVFAGWQTIMANALHKEGVSLPRAKRLATLSVASIEGTVAMCRVAKSSQSLDAVRTELEALFKTALAESTTESKGTTKA